MEKRRRRPTEEEAFRRFNEVFDFEVYCLEFEHNERIGAMLREGVREAFDERQQTFHAVLAQHPATLAENARRAETRRLEEEHLEKIAERRREREERRRRAGVRHLARRWHAKLAPAQAG
jgi:hypothetical protein